MSTADPMTAPGIGSNLIAPYRRLKPGPGRSAAEVTHHQQARINRAMVEVVLANGYSSATVREITRIAGISTRAFYECYSGKEECFLRVHRVLAQRLLRRVELPADASGSDDRLTAAVDAIVDEWARDRDAAWFLLVGPYGAGSAALKQLRLMCRSLGVRLSRSLCNSTEEKRGLTGLITDGVAIGLVAAARSAMLNERDVRWDDLRCELTRWALSYSCSIPEMEILQAVQAHAERGDVCLQASCDEANDQAPLPGNDLALLHAAIAKLAAGGDSGLLTARRVCTSAGVSRRSFDRHFSSIDECLVAAADFRFKVEIGKALRNSSNWSSETAVDRLIDLCGKVACDPSFANLCFGDFIEDGEQLIRRDRLLGERLGALFEVAASTGDRLTPIEAAAASGALLGLLQDEVTGGRAGSVQRQAPTFAYLTLAPTSGAS